MAEVKLLIPISLDDLADSITLDWTLDYKELMEFILQIDEGMADYDFTKTLWKKLKKITDKEDKAIKKEGW